MENHLICKRNLTVKLTRRSQQPSECYYYIRTADVCFGAWMDVDISVLLFEFS